MRESHIPGGQDLNLSVEPWFEFGPVEWKKKLHQVTGRPDYAVWYGEEEQDEDHHELNIVIIEAKSRDLVSQGVPQALGYMGKISVL